jgi:hypothetical protein
MHIDEQVSYVVFSPNTAPVNTAPVADDQSVSTPEDTAVAITLTASDAQGDPPMAPFSLTVKYQNGQFALLAEDSVPYVTGRNYQLKIAAQGSSLQVSIDGSPVFSVNDSTFSSGTIALYSWGNSGGHFDDILIESMP